MFATVADKLQSLLGRSFLLANFFPFVIFAAVSALVARGGIAGADQVLTWGTLTLTENTSMGVLVLVALAALAYIMSPLTVAVRRILEDGGPLRSVLRKIEQMECNQLRHERSIARRAHATAMVRDGQYRPDLQGGYMASRSLPEARNPPAVEEAADKIDLAVDHLGNPEALQNAVSSLLTAFRTNSMATPSDNTSRLDSLYEKLLNLLSDTLRFTEQELSMAQARLKQRFATGAVKPTRLANIRAASEAHCMDAYGAEFEFLWPRILPLVAKDQKVSDALDAAQATVDFALEMILLSCLFTVGWLVVLAAIGNSVLLLLCVAAGGLALLVLFCTVLDGAYARLGLLARAVIDANRLELLKQLRIAPPGSLSMERATWQRLQRSGESLGTIDIAYLVPKP
jgi:hypothetical protein